jgi:hypothetical protein
MKKSAVLLITLLTLVSSATWGANSKCATANGSITTGKVTLGCMNIIGSATLNQTTLTGPLTLEGPLIAKYSKLTSINVTGTTNLQYSTISGNITVTGPELQITNCTLYAPIEYFDAVVLTITNSTAEAITIHSTGAVIVTLKNSRIDGDITFKNGNGTVNNIHSQINGKILQK